MKKTAFTLIELSIVLVIIALLIASITTGSRLVQQARLLAIMKEINLIEKSVKTFIANYGEKPGDFSRAGIIWGSDCGGNTAAPTGCNGNGDGVIQDSVDSDTESFRFWQHMQLAGILDRSFTGVTAFSSGTDPHHDKNNSLVSEYQEDLLFKIQNVTGDDWSTHSLHPHNNIRLNKNEYESWGVTSGAPFTPFEAHMLDKKFDDELPTEGIIEASRVWTGTAWDPKVCESGGVYNFAESSGACYILISGDRIFEL